MSQQSTLPIRMTYLIGQAVIGMTLKDAFNESSSASATKSMDEKIESHLNPLTFVNECTAIGCPHDPQKVVEIL